MPSLLPITGRPTKSWPAALLAGCAAVLYTWYALMRHWAYRSGGFDLGIFDQAVRSYAQGRLPVSTLRDPELILLGDHFHPILAVLAPFYRLFPSAETLLVAQALLLAVSVFPITRLAVALLGTRTGLTLGACYGLSWGLLNAIAFDFHEIAFAVPLIAFALVEYLSGRPGRAVAIASVLVFVKEDLGLTLAVLGLLVALRPRTRRLGLLTAAGGTTASLLTVFVVIPAFSAYGNYRYLGKGGLKPADPVFAGQVLDLGKVHLVLLLLLPTLFLALRSPLVLLLLPTLAWRLGSTNNLYWIPSFHYDAVLMPVLFCALLHSLVLRHSLVLLRPRLAGRTGVWARRAVTGALVASCLTLLLQSPVVDGPGRRGAFTVAADELVALVPDNATVSTTDAIAPHLTSRTDVYLLRDYRETEWTLSPTSDPNYLAWPRDGEVRARNGDLVLIHHRGADVSSQR